MRAEWEMKRARMADVGPEEGWVVWEWEWARERFGVV